MYGRDGELEEPVEMDASRLPFTHRVGVEGVMARSDAVGVEQRPPIGPGRYRDRSRAVNQYSPTTRRPSRT